MKFLLFILLFLFSCEKNSSSPLCCLDACDKLGNVEDCAGVCGGDAVIDCEGVCEGNAIEDCIGECGGSIVWCFDADGILDNYNDYQFNGSITSIVTADNISIGNLSGQASLGGYNSFIGHSSGLYSQTPYITLSYRPHNITYLLSVY